MTEREFICDALGEILNYNFDEKWLSDKIDKFLEKHHKEYYEITFTKKEDNILTFKGVPIEWDKDEIFLVQDNQIIGKIINVEKENDDYDYAADDMNFDEARERRYK